MKITRRRVFLPSEFLVLYSILFWLPLFRCLVRMLPNDGIVVIVERVRFLVKGMLSMSRRALLLMVALLLTGGRIELRADEHPLSVEKRKAMDDKFDAIIARESKAIKATPKNVDSYSRRGDACFFRGRFKQAVADYEQMVVLEPQFEKKHWRRGIAYFYAQQYKKAAHQFEIYNSFDNIDRENGIWRFFSQAKAYGLKRARKGLLKYEKDDREPFPSVYQLFAEETTPAEILKQIESARIDDDEREKRLFYAHLYIGLNHAILKQPKRAEKHLKQAVANKWGPKAGFGPHYMWQVGMLHYELLRRTAKR